MIFETFDDLRNLIRFLSVVNTGAAPLELPAASVVSVSDDRDQVARDGLQFT